ncbi:MAG TPA: hypothetical protein VHH88_00460 [Verrucomicrobiae bacterium]|nr:hypothetical protein [Verrucomicrobiae bacterium]
MDRVFFTLASARSGTLYLKGLFQNNIPDCHCRHEPFFDWGNPTLLGPAIYDAFAGRLDRVRALLARKRAHVDRLNASLYLESNHAFLKSAYLVALEFFPEMRLIHLIRDPLKAAKSEANREMWRRRVHAPFHYYRGDDGQRHFYWALTRNEPIFKEFGASRLSLFQLYLLQWIEIENRAISFVKDHNLTSRCRVLHSPRDLNDPVSIKAMFDFFELKPAQPRLVLAGRTNKSIGQTTVITPEDEAEAGFIIQNLPARYLEIFQQEPYQSQKWSARFRCERSATPSLAPI